MVYRPSIDQKLCFVLMPFKPPFNGYYDSLIKPLVKKAGLEPLRADEIYGSKPIIQDVWDSIWKARIVIADVSERNPNVNYELGLCHALGIPTILITNSLDDVPFDYRHRRCIIYKTEEVSWERKLKTDIKRSIAALISETNFDSDLRWPDDVVTAPRATNSVFGSLSIDKPREIIIRGVAETERLVAKAYGPSGVNISVALGAKGTGSYKQGVRVVSGVHASNPLEQNGMDQARYVAEQVYGLVGDGTKTAILLFYALLKYGNETMNSGYPLAEFIRGMDAALETALAALKAQSRATTSKELEFVARTAADDSKIAKVVAQAIAVAGTDGIIAVSIGDSAEPALTVSEGFRFERGFLNEYFINQPETRQCVFEDCLLLIYDRKISNLASIQPLLEQVMKSEKPLLIIADDVEGEVLATLVVNSLQARLKCAVVRAPGSGAFRSSILEDIAVLTGGSAVLAEVGTSLSSVSLNDLGSATRVVIEKDATTIFEGKGDKRAIKRHVSRLRSQIAVEGNAYDREKMQQRLSSLVGKSAAIWVGGSAPPDVDDQRYRAETALHSARAAKDSGWVCGGGIALLQAKIAVLQMPCHSVAQRAGSYVVAAALERPFLVLAETGKGSPAQILAEVNANQESNRGFDAASSSVTDLVSAGVLDAFQVVQTSLEISYSYAKQILKTGIWNLAGPAKNEDPQD